MYDHVIVGTGMSALGVIEALVQEKDKSILVLDFSEQKNDEVLINGESKNIGKIGNGGNSMLWHGVVSYLSNTKGETYLVNFINLFYSYYKSDRFNNLYKDYSFIPLKPLRPLKIIKQKFKNKISIEDNKLISFEIFHDKVMLKCSKGNIETKQLWLCTGLSSTLDLLNKSNLLSDKICHIDDHMVGYFGQIKSDDILNKEHLKSIFTKKGHYKKFYKIDLTENRSLYVNLRPAFFSFRDLEKAGKSRSFFGQSTNIIIKKLFLSLSPALVLEAIYNKFGIQFSSDLYNIVGHIEMPQVVKYTTDTNKIEYLSNSVEFSQEDKRIICEYFECDIHFGNKVELSPGIHFMNPTLKLDTNLIDCDLLKEHSGNRLTICGGLSMGLTSPEHPSFSYLVNSFLKAKSFLKH